MPFTLHKRHHQLAVVAQQRDILERPGRHKPFDEMLRESGVGPLTRSSLRIMQINVGRMCNQVCKHCHVDAGPDRTEIMTRETMELCLRALARTDIEWVDVTGGAPEMNPDFRWLVERLGQKELAWFVSTHRKNWSNCEQKKNLDYFLPHLIERR